MYDPTKLVSSQIGRWAEFDGQKSLPEAVWSSFDQILRMFPHGRWNIRQNWIRTDSWIEFHKATARGDVPSKFKFVFDDKFAKNLWFGRTTVAVDGRPLFSKQIRLRTRIVTGNLHWKANSTFHYNIQGICKVLARFRKLLLQPSESLLVIRRRCGFYRVRPNPRNCPLYRLIKKYWTTIK